ncbi:hypothetical protein DCC62_08405 [candidate division KSB1 bacterium]|nr:MAG: hypothetical protein DCC62_08405 [candidate division KSB1 bacterium]
MNVRILFSLVVLLALGLAGGILLSTQAMGNLTSDEIFARAKSGDWVEIKGIVQADYSVLAVEFKFLGSGMGDDDWELTGKVRAASPLKSEIHVASVVAQITANTKLNKPIKGFDDIQAEMLVKLEGTYRDEGIFVAKDVSSKAAQLKDKPQLAQIIEAVGRIGHVDEERRTIVVMGIQVHITD